MMVFALSLAMVVALASATAVAIHEEASKARIKATVRKTRIMN